MDLNTWKHLSKPKTKMRSTEYKMSPFYCLKHGQAVPMDIKVDSFETREDELGGSNGKYTVFLIKLSNCCFNWTLYRRFSQFVELEADLIREHKSMVIKEELPSKTLSLLWSASVSALESRRSELDVYIKALLQNNPSLCSSNVFQNFFSPHEIMNDKYNEKSVDISLSNESSSDVYQKVSQLQLRVQQLEKSVAEFEEYSKNKKTALANIPEQVFPETKLDDCADSLGSRITLLEEKTGIKLCYILIYFYRTNET